MTHDIHTLTEYIRVCLIVAGVGATSLPVVYFFFPWRSRLLGKIFMLKALSFAAALDVTILFSFWTPHNILVQFWVEAIIFTAIAITTSTMTFMIWYLNYYVRKKRLRR